jgi:hypothetical protein
MGAIKWFPPIDINAANPARTLGVGLPGQPYAPASKPQHLC